MRHQLPMFPPETEWTLPDLSTLVDWDGADRVCLDVETFDPHLKETGPSVRTGGHLVGVGVAVEGGPTYYLPFAHANGTNLPKENVIRYLRDQCKKFEGEIVGANLAYDLDWLWEEGVDMPLVKRFRDVLIAEPCINENKFFYSLDSVAQEWLGDQKDKTVMLEAARAYGMKKDTELGSYIHILPPEYVGMYGEQDVNLPLRILREQEREIERQEIKEVWDLESDVLPALVRMRRRGVAVNEDRLMEVDIRCMQERVEASDFITRETGVPVGPEDAMQKGILVKALNNVGFDIGADDSVDKFFINRNSDNPVVEALGRLRKWDTLRKLSIDPVKKHLVNGRIHCSFNQMAAEKEGTKGKTKGARYGRLSCEHVNMQQQPSRDEDIAPIWRRIYMPDDGGMWAACDYSQQEPRVLVHWAETIADMDVPGFPMRGAKEMGQRYRDDPDADNHEMMARLTYGDEVMDNADKATFKKLRGNNKTIFLGLTYGMGGPTLCGNLGLPTKVITLRRGPRAGQRLEVAGDEAQAIMDKVNSKLPYLKEMERLAKEQADKNGYIRTLLGRKCRFKMGDDGLNYWGTQKALNRLIQGSAADQTKKAVVEADRAGFKLQLQVHDELDMTVENREEAEALGKLMSECVPLTVPSKVDVEIGPSWGEAE